MNYLDELKEVIERLHHSYAVYVETVPVKEVFQGQTVWEGEVEVFDLSDHPEASRVFAWAYDFEDPDKETQHVTVLQIPPATTPENAVKASIVASYKEQNEQVN
jgi:hypothetical protein